MGQKDNQSTTKNATDHEKSVQLGDIFRTNPE